jgi:L-ascorbate metabolism protein UlaG (beta-lactamase superfamily)
VKLTYLGQSGIILESAGERIVIDPYLSESARLVNPMWARALPIPIPPSALAGSLAVLCTHEHIDHLDPLTIAPLLEVSPGTDLYTSEAAIRSLPFAVDAARVHALRGEGESLEIGPFTIRPVPAAHSVTYTLEQTELGHRWLGFVVEADGRRVFHAGDAVDYPGLAESVGAVDLACVPINGRGREDRDIVGNFEPAEAADLCRRVNASQALAMHWDMFAANPGDPGAFRSALAGSGMIVHVLAPMETIDLLR